MKGAVAKNVSQEQLGKSQPRQRPPDRLFVRKALGAMQLVQNRKCRQQLNGGEEKTGHAGSRADRQGARPRESECQHQRQRGQRVEVAALKITGEKGECQREGGGGQAPDSPADDRGMQRRQPDRKRRCSTEKRQVVQARQQRSGSRESDARASRSSRAGTQPSSQPVAAA